MEVRLIGDPVLRKKTKEIEKFDEELKLLIEKMFSEMYRLDGVGLAAPQVGMSYKFFVMDDGENKKTVINPKIKSFSEDQIIFEEGCLSIPEVFAEIERPKTITVEYYNESGEKIEEELTDYTARIFQHENDHLNGILFTDKLSVVAKQRIKKRLNELIKEGKKKGKELGVIEP
ncbi:peptide deformylase [Geotoga petraea]|jgi:peptide deformylase|uniref:Peptide deformylase n=1 Tax=Geotoga petraea TaxID=28234 RepID=A0A1G6LKX5_9BACT|nr:peptide deformylase [Geotoga petraea]TGG87615.1 peptide deformylase [Geotoga petraea]SDC43841.1 peptide deformylase [Geotoga petraea]